ncbi:hypothetical protein [Enterobacter sichuanensis]|uniref:hypothetical protein n=1 Tax=Enterobacter sichuanensis TaxID=2071710 RepID=UPI0021CEBAEA|nr:hypothetical protein [Enterobacter sichuanensis]MCU6193892.1 hypothetical protein [Enterobacter sichuanensis]
MNNIIFYPKLVRKEPQHYHNKNGVFYANYLENYNNVAEDCLHRCVYCDATEMECGGDNFSLDHFRPKQVFVNLFNGILITHPHNLYLSCQKCNVLKSNDWKGSIDEIDGPSYINKQGYIDRFKDNTSDFMKVTESGEIISVNDEGPADYMIKKMLLNRSNRIYLRKKRIIDSKINELNKIITDKMENLILYFNTEEVDNRKIKNDISLLIQIKKDFDTLLEQR